MLALLFLIPALPFVSSFGLGVFGHRLSKKTTAIVGTGSIGMVALLSLWMGMHFLISPPEGNAYSQTLWTWMQIGNFRPEFSLRLDALSLVMTLVVSVVSFLIHIYSTEFMLDDENFSRFFAYMNLFVGSMLTLVLADNLLLLYLGWEGVGLCSYLLIGFWYKNPENGRAARKAFVITRIGDTSMAIGLFLLFINLGTLEIQPLLARAASQWQVGSPLAVLAAALLLGGAIGKSAQLPLQTWLPDAMAGPTPVSALIHAATMVTAGVYLIARTHTLFALAPTVQFSVAVIGAATLVISGFSALTQSDIKRVLAYSTISQVGYMFLALGVGAWSAAIFHFMTHAFFKALLFLSAGSVIQALHEEHNIFKMGGLRRKIPWTFWTFLVGASSLSALPLVTAGYYSKDLILNETLSSPIGGPWLWAAGLLGAFLTSLYSFRLVFIVFFGEAHGTVEKKPGMLIIAPLVVLATLSVVAGFVELPPFLGGNPFLSEFLNPVFARSLGLVGTREVSAWFSLIAPLVSVFGIVLAYVLYIRMPRAAAKLQGVQRFPFDFWFSGWGFDWLYNLIIVRPFLFLSRVSKEDVFDLPFDALAWLSLSLNRCLSRLQNGNIRWYAAVIGTGAAVLVLLVEIL